MTDHNFFDSLINLREPDSRFDQLISLIINSKEYTYSDLFSEVLRIVDKINALPLNSFVCINGNYSLSNIAAILACLINQHNFSIFIGLSSRDQESRLAQISKSFEVYDLDSILSADSVTQSLHNSLRCGSIFLFSSGSTGLPKLIKVPISDFVRNYKFRKNPNHLSRRVILTLLLDHIGGLNTLLTVLLNFDTLVFTSSSHPSIIIDTIRKYSVQILPTTPSILNLLLQSGDFHSKSCQSLIVITYGTEKMPVVIEKKLRSFFKKIRLIQTFGTSEAGIIPTLPSVDPQKIRFKNKDDFKLVDNILYLKPLYSSAYSQDSVISKTTDSDGWFNTGDTAVLNDDGTITITGREKDVINVGGFKVSPTEIENEVLKLEFVIDCLCYPVDNPFTGQAVALKVSLTSSCSDYKKAISEIKSIFVDFDKKARPVLITVLDEIKITSRGKKSRN